MTEIRDKNQKLSAAWRRCVGSGNMALALRRDYQEALALCRRAIGFEYVRGHGILSDAVGTCRDCYWPATHTTTPHDPATNLTYVYQIYDALLETGVRPFVELGFMPQALASGAQTVFYWKGNVTPPADHGQWRRLVTDFVQGLIDRYGLQEVATWPFEVWNEPDTQTFFSGDQEAYFRLYAETVRAIKEVEPSLRVGGPATCPGGIDWITPFLEMCDRDDIPVDFTSTHSYYGSEIDPRGEFDYQSLFPVDHGLKQFCEARERIDQSPLSNLPLHITEYNTSWSPRCPVHDTALNAAYLGRLLSEGGDYADSFAYWTFSDVFEEADVPRSIFHGGFGLLAAHNIPKPTFHLFAFFARLGQTILYRDEYAVVTAHNDGSLAGVLWNPCSGSESDRSRRDYTIVAPCSFESGVLSTQTVDEQNGNAWNAWRVMGRPRHPSMDQVQLLHHAATPSLQLSHISAEGGAVRLTGTLSRNEVRLVVIRPHDKAKADYDGLDDTRIPGYDGMAAMKGI